MKWAYEPCFAMVAIGWNTARATDGTNGGPNQAGGALPADAALTVCGWATCQSRDHFPAHSPEYTAAKMSEGHGMANLNDQVTLVGWATTRVADAAGAAYQYNRGSKENGITLMLVDQARLTASGPGPTGFSLGPNGWETRPASGQLAPEFSRWLMALPPEWCDCAATAMASLPRKPRPSSKRVSKSGGTTE